MARARLAAGDEALQVRVSRKRITFAAMHSGELFSIMKPVSPSLMTSGMAPTGVARAAAGRMAVRIAGPPQMLRL